MKPPVFTGTCTALITPFQSTGAIDYTAFAKQIDRQLEAGIDALCVCGTTGESAALSAEEHVKLVDYCVDYVAGRCKVLAGSGSNDTVASLYLCQHAEESGADALLLVTPYYNKTTGEGLVRHYSEIAKNTTLPIILYNVPSRTGVNIKPEIALKLSKIENIVAIKEASGDLSQIAQTINFCRDNLKVYSGNDDQIIPILSLGGIGVISVLSNIKPKYTHEMCYNYFDGNVKKAAQMQIDAIPLINALFSEVNPIPVKEALNICGYDFGEPRLPLVPMSKEKREILMKCMEC